ncbi:MAG TPA: ThuA domain-containing protein [Stellaceae bacterium]|nr:ThuA domain-containing protein [Stellaceae bacterium]
MTTSRRGAPHHNRFACAALALTIAVTAAAAQAQQPAKRVLYVTTSAGYRHDVLDLSKDVLKDVGARSGAFTVTSTEDLSVFTRQELQTFAALIFFTTGELPMTDSQKRAFLEFVRGGKGFVGVHSATDTFYDWPEYLALIGGYFNDHPWHQKVTIDIADRSNAIVAFLAPSLSIADEIYQISDFDYRHAHVLLQLDPRSVDLTLDTVRPRFYGWPLAWTRSYGNGRVFYTALGHDPAVWRDPRYQQLLSNAILWVTRRNTSPRGP